MTEQEKELCYKTTIILGKDTSQMRVNDIIEELVHVIEQKGNMKTVNRMTQNQTR